MHNDELSGAALRRPLEWRVIRIHSLSPLLSVFASFCLVSRLFWSRSPSSRVRCEESVGFYFLSIRSISISFLELPFRV